MGETNVAAEMSLRDNMPLAATGATVVMPGSGSADGGNKAAFPKGRTLHINASAIAVMAANPLWEGASFIGEFAYNRLLSVSDNKDQLDPLATKDASAIQFVFQPEYFQVLPGLDLQVPIGVSYGLAGRSSVNGVLFPSEKGGNVSIGVNRITSYNVCYTKLLRMQVIHMGQVHHVVRDQLVMAGASHVGVGDAVGVAAVERAVVGQGGFVGWCVAHPDPQEAVALHEREGAHLGGGRDVAVAMGVAVARITSYNVCYTKLLRRWPPPASLPVAGCSAAPTTAGSRLASSRCR